jgi:predicted RNase H-like HicB family nuclease
VRESHFDWYRQQGRVPNGHSSVAALGGAQTGIEMKIKAFIHPAEEGGFWAEVPAFPGCYSEGETLDDTIANIRDAAVGWMEGAERQRPPEPSTAS